MKKTNKTKFAILGMIFDKPRSGYDIKKFMLESTAHFWQESDASIYPMLKLLEKEGLVVSQSEFVGKRERNIFEITETGKKEFSRWLALPAEDGTYRNELLLKLFFGANAKQEDLVQQLVLHQKKLKDLVRQFNDVEEMLSHVPDNYPHKRFWLITLKYGLINTQAEKLWLDECFKILKITRKV